MSKVAIIAVIMWLSVVSHALLVDKYNVPDGPDKLRTPGALCTHPNSYRYDEKIPYCERNVSGSVKNKVIQEYDQRLGFSIQKLPRNDFKIDHFVPLSIGGANDETNLWPQHKQIYAYSDPLEAEVSNLMIVGKIKQAEAIRVIKECKLNLPKCSDLMTYLKSLE